MLFFLIALTMIIACDQDSPVSSEKDVSPVQEEQNVNNNITVTPIYEDIIYSAFVNAMAKLSDEGLIKVIVSNANTSQVTLMVSSEIENYTNSVTETITLHAASTDTVHISPVIPAEKLNSLTENTTVTYHTRVSLLHSESEEKLFDQTTPLK